MSHMDPIHHKQSAERHKAAYEHKQAAAQKEKGLLIVFTGAGKGKSTAAFGMGLRALGHGMKLGVVQFIKGALPSAERECFHHFANCDFQTIGNGYTWNSAAPDADIATARRAWRECVRMIEDPSYDMVILDELNVVLKHAYLSMDEVLPVLTSRRTMLHIVVTGRHAPPELIDTADLVSEMTSIKHPYREQGVKAQKGVEF